MDARPNDAVRSLPREPDGTHFWPWRASFWLTVKIVYNPSRILSIWTSTMARNYSGSYTNPMKSENYAHDYAFLSVKRTLFSSEWHPLTLAGTIYHTRD